MVRSVRFLLLLALSLWAAALAGGKGGRATGAQGLGKEKGKEKGKGDNKAGKDNGKSKAAIPRSKAKGAKGSSAARGSGGGGGLVRSVGGGLVYRMFREMKTAFGSELEALTLTLTRPSEAAVPEASIDELVQVFEGEYENPQFTVGLLAKLSRKLGEPNVYTKLKSLLCVHRLMEHSTDESQTVLLQCMRSLRSEVDEKLGQPFFAAESVETVGESASNVGEAEASEVAKEYVAYVFDYLDCKGETPRKITAEHATPDRLEALLSLIEHGLEVEDRCQQQQKGTVLRQCSDCCKRNRAWLLKQAARLYELRAYADDADIKKEVEAVLAEFQVKFAKEEGGGAGGAKREKVPVAAPAAAAESAEAAPAAAEPVVATKPSGPGLRQASAEKIASPLKDEDDAEDEKEKIKAKSTTAMKAKATSIPSAKAKANAKANAKAISSKKKKPDRGMARDEDHDESDEGEDDEEEDDE